MRTHWLLLGAGLLAAVLAIGAVACEDEEDGGAETPTVGLTPEGETPTVGETPAEGETPAAETPAAEESPDGTDFATVKVTENAELGPILTTADGYTLYQFANDEPGVSNCGAGCTDLWPPLPAAGTPTGGEGVTGTLGTITRDDGTTQVTYDGLPLYLYANDAAPGDTNGNGFAGLWSVVSVQ